MSRPKFPLAIVLSVLALMLLMLPSLSGCSNSGLPTEPGVTDFNREPFFEPMPGMKHFTIQPVGPSGMFGQEGYSPICEDVQPVFSVKIYAPSDGPLANVLNVTIHTTIDGQKVKNKPNPVTGTVDFSPSAPLSTGRHSAVIQLTLENNAYPPVVRNWLFDVYNEPPRITSVLVDDAKNQAIIFFDRPVPKEQVQDISRWNINSESFALNIDVLPGLMSAIIDTESNLKEYLDLPIPVILEFISDKGSVLFTISKGPCGKSGSRNAQVWPDCAPVDEGDFTAFPGAGNPHHFFESEFSAWCYRMEVEPNHCPISSTADYTTGCIEHVWPWDELELDCGFSENEDNPTISNITTYTGGFIIEDPPCYDDPSCFYHTFTYSPSTSISFAGEIWADNDLEPPPPEELDFETYVGQAAVSFSADLQNPDIICGPFILTGWQAAREIEGLISDPGDSVFHYGLYDPPTVEEYIEKLRTEWADHIFVFAGGADPGGSLFPFVPLELDIYSETFACPPTVAVTDGFLLMRDYYPLGALPGDYGYGDETIPWADSMSYPLGYPIDGNAYREEQYALWDLTVYGYVDDICDEDGFSMRVRVTDHVGNWKRSGMIEDMQIGVPGVDENEVQVVSLHAVDPTITYSWQFSGPAPEQLGLNKGIASIIHLRDVEGKAYITYIAKITATQTPPLTIFGSATSTETPDPGPACETSNFLTFYLLEDPVLINDLIDLLGPLPECGFFYSSMLTIQDTPNAGGGGPLLNTIFVSSRDDSCWPENRDDHTFIAANSAPLIQGGPTFDFEGYSNNLNYGKRRGSGRENPDPSDDEFKLAWYNYERMIKTGGFEMVTAELGSKELALPVQSQANLVFINSHGVFGQVALPEISQFTDQGQNEPEYVYFSALSSDPLRYDFVPEFYTKFPFFKKQVYAPPYADPSWLVLCSCSQLSLAGSPESARDYWHSKLYDGPNADKYFDCIAGYRDNVDCTETSSGWIALFLKYCADDFSDMLEDGAVYDPDYYAWDMYYSNVDGQSNKVNWLVDAWLASHIKEIRDWFTYKDFAETALHARAINDNYCWYIKEEFKPSNIPLLQKKVYLIYRTNWNGDEL